MGMLEYLLFMLVQLLVPLLAFLGRHYHSRDLQLIAPLTKAILVGHIEL